ncbi:MAG: DUF370 domain-containing protein [Clostridia bacterium]|nr:DUF370 domain-containing protein [Clostridia bacterium]MBR6679686.1 DUF370 domain-containing protein [Clostridia bacterium]
MFLHVGNNRNIRIRDIVGIFDMDNTTVSAVTRKYLGKKQRAMQVESAGLEIPKSFVLYCEYGVDKVCFSALSVATLQGRIESGATDKEQL